MVIGEDLGTVPEGFREQMAEWGIWSYQVMMFERDDHGSFRGVDHYAANALVTFNTHDLSTYAGWRSFSDLKLKRSIGIDPGESDDARWHALHMLSDVLRHHAIDDHDLYAVAGFLARTKSRLLAISLEDLLGVVDQPNIPGTVNEHPNWRQRLPLTIDAMAAAIDVAALKAATAERSRTEAYRSLTRRSAERGAGSGLACFVIPQDYLHRLRKTLVLVRGRDMRRHVLDIVGGVAHRERETAGSEHRQIVFHVADGGDRVGRNTLASAPWPERKCPCHGPAG